MIPALRALAFACGALAASAGAYAQQWSATAPSPVDRLEGAAAVVGDRLYAFGGFAAGLGAQTAVHSYDPAAGQWTVRASMPRAVTHSQAAVVGTRVYIAGGFEGSNPGTAIADVQVYDTIADSWSTTSVPDLPAARASGALIASGTRIHYVGGLTANRCTDVVDHWVLDTTNPGAGWLTRAPLPETKNHFNGVALGGLLYAIGGQRGHDCGLVHLATAHRYDPVGNSWTPLPPMPGERSHHEPSTFAWNRFVVAGGGTSNSAPALATVVAFDTVRNTWRRWPDLPQARRSPILQRVGATLVFATGGVGTNGVDAIAAAAVNRVRDDAPRVLFVRGSTRSAGVVEGGDDAARDSQLSDIDDESTLAGNHGWSELRALLESDGFLAEQVAETPETPTGTVSGVPVPLASLALDDYALLVFGSNNASYAPAAVQAVRAFVDAGGGALFVSDANFGSDWSDAPSSDQSFLTQFGLVMHQDHETYAVGPAQFVVPAHPILAGVTAFEGEGVSPVLRNVPPAGVSSTILTRVNANVRVNTPPFGPLGQGALRAATLQDAVLVVASTGGGRVAVHFDRNTFFNANGAGTDITRLDHRTYAVNLFDWLAPSQPPPLFEDGFE